MTGTAKTKGDRAERELAAILADLTGYPVRRMLGAGRLDDVGDMDGIPGVVIQAADWRDKVRAIRQKPLEAELQRENAKAALAVTAIRLHGGEWRMVMTLEQWAAWLKARA